MKKQRFFLAFPIFFLAAGLTIASSQADRKKIDEYLFVVQSCGNMGFDAVVVRKLADGSFSVSGYPRSGGTGAAPPRTPVSTMNVRLAARHLIVERGDMVRLWMPVKRPASPPSVRIRKIDPRIGIRVPAGAAKPDLAIQEVILTPSVPKRGEKILTEVYIVNRGAAEAGFASAADLLRVTLPDGTEIRDFPQFPEKIGPGEERPVVFYLPPFPEEGTFRIEARVDPDNRISESDESGNTFAKDITVKGALDPKVNLKIVDARVHPSRLTDETRNWTIDTKIINGGPEPTLEYNRVDILGFQLTGGRMETGVIGYYGIKPGEEDELDYVFLNAPSSRAGTFQGTLSVDPLNQIKETDETDNSRPFEYTVLGAADVPDKTNLSVESVRFIPEVPTKDDDVAIEIRIRNDGPHDAVFEGNAIVWMGIDPAPQGPQFFARSLETWTIPAGQTLVRKVDGRKLDPGIYEIEFEVNPCRWVTETDYSDNVKKAVLTVRSGK
jgi:hypothetical protein